MKARTLTFFRRNSLLLFMIVFGTVATLGLLGSGCTKKQPEAGTSGETAKILHVYCWSNYFSPEMINAFEQKTGTKVDLNYFSSNEELLAKLQAGAQGYDLIVPTGYLIKALKELKLIEPLGAVDWPELKKLSLPRRLLAFDPNHEFTIPYQWGTSGIAVNRARVKAKVDSWAWMFEHPELKGQLTMLDDAPAVVGVALKYLGFSYNESSPEALAKAKQLLLKQKKMLKAFTPDTQPVLEAGEVALAHAYSGDSLQVSRRNPNIEYVLPKEGGEVYLDNLAIPRGARSPALAKEFMRFTLDQKMAAVQVRHLLFSPVVDVREQLKGVPGGAELVSNTSVFPSDDLLRNYEMMLDEPARIEAIQRLWTELKSI